MLLACVDSLGAGRKRWELGEGVMRAVHTQTFIAQAHHMSGVTLQSSSPSSLGTRTISLHLGRGMWYRSAWSLEADSLYQPSKVQSPHLPSSV